MDKMLSTGDTNKNGLIDKNEFVNYFMSLCKEKTAIYLEEVKEKTTKKKIKADQE